MTGLPTVNVLIAFTSNYTAATATWTDVTAYVRSFRTFRGRRAADEVCEAGTCTLELDNRDGRFDPDYTAGPYYGYIRPNRRVRITATVGGTTYYVFSGYADSWTRTWPGGLTHSVTTIEATDRFKILAQRTLGTYSRPQEKTAPRLTALLDNAGNGLVPSVSYSINPDGYNTRTLVTHSYDGDNALQACQDIAVSEGGSMFCDGQGMFTFQGTRYRTDNTRSTTSSATFGTTSGAIPVEDSIDPTVDDTLMANRVLVTDGAGTVHVQEDATYQAMDGIIEYDIGATMLVPLEAPDRAADVLLLRKDPRPRYDSLTFDCLTSDAGMAQAVTREISDRITVALAGTGGWSRDQYIESVAHEVTVAGEQSWMTTFGLSGAYGGARMLP